jgi:ubiquinone/menaquinone biosynthesis C-methylase UbiE
LRKGSNVATHSFDDSEAYEQFMGRWSRRIGEAFLAWLQPPIGVHWLEVGCGTGIFTALIASMCAPAKVVGIDPAHPLIAHARRRAKTSTIEFRLGDVQDLPVQDASFDVLASSLVLNFVSDRERALSEICRVARPGGLIGACVWDFAAERSPSGPLRRAMRRIGIDVPPIPGTEASGLSALAELFEGGALTDVVTTSIDVDVSFHNFNDFWNSQTPNNAPITKFIAAMAPKDRDDLRAMLRSELQHLAGGAVKYSASANAIKARRFG